MEDCQIFENAGDLSDILREQEQQLNMSSGKKLDNNLRKSIANQKRITGSFGNLDFAAHGVSNHHHNNSNTVNNSNYQDEEGTVKLDESERNTQDGSEKMRQLQVLSLLAKTSHQKNGGSIGGGAAGEVPQRAFSSFVDKEIKNNEDVK